MSHPVDLSLERLEARVRSHTPHVPRATRRAAVAVLLRYPGGDPDVLLMQRTARKDDRWSGHVSFPGGREEDDDPDLLATAIRETREEVGVDLDATARLLGPLDSVRAVARGQVLPMTISPFVFVQTAPAEFVLHPDEASRAFWLPLGAAARGELDAVHPYALGPMHMSFPCWQWEGHTVWGLTYQMLRNLLDLLRG